MNIMLELSSAGISPSRLNTDISGMMRLSSTFKTEILLFNWLLSTFSRAFSTENASISAQVNSVNNVPVAIKRQLRLQVAPRSGYMHDAPVPLNTISIGNYISMSQTSLLTV